MGNLKGFHSYGFKDYKLPFKSLNIFLYHYCLCTVKKFFFISCICTCRIQMAVNIRNFFLLVSVRGSSRGRFRHRKNLSNLENPDYPGKRDIVIKAYNNRGKHGKPFF